MAFSPGFTEPAIPMVHAYSPWGLVPGPAIYAGVPAAGASLTAANTAYFVPVMVPITCVIRRVWWANGSTTTAGSNLSVAVYASTATNIPGAKVVECAATAQGTASQVQFVDVTDTTIAAGLYWLAIAASSNSSTTVFSRTTAANYDATFLFEQGSITVGAMPATATPVESAQTYLPVFGFATTASP